MTTMTCTYERIRVILGKLYCSYKYFIDKGAIIGFHLSIFFSAYPLLMFDFFYKRDFCIDTQANIKLFTLNRAALLWTQFIYSLKFLSLNSPTLINFTMITSYFFLGQRLHVLQRFTGQFINFISTLQQILQTKIANCPASSSF